MCSAAVITLDCGALATTMPRRVAASTSTLSTPTPARPTAWSRSARAIRSAVDLRGRADQDPVELADPPLELAVLPVVAELDVEAGRAQQVDARVADLLLDQNSAGAVGRVIAPGSRRRAGGTPASRNTRWAAPTPAPCSTS